MGKEASPEKVVEIRRKTRRRCSAEEKIRIVLEGLRGEESIATLCRKEGLGLVLPVDGVTLLFTYAILSPTINGMVRPLLKRLAPV